MSSARVTSETRREEQTKLCIILRLFIVAVLFVVPAKGATVQIDNPFGKVSIRAEMGDGEVKWNATCPARRLTPDDVVYQKSRAEIVLIIRPADRVQIDVAITVPHTTVIRATTGSGDIALTGLIELAELKTSSGGVSITAPLRLTRIKVVSTKQPQEIDAATTGDIKFVSGRMNDLWALASTRPDLERQYGKPLHEAWTQPWERVFGNIHILGFEPKLLRVADLPLTRDSWVHEHTEAPDALESLWRIFKSARRDGNAPPQKPEEVTKDAGTASAFRSDVRLVTLAVPVYSKSGHPVPGLTASDFELWEDDVPQRISFANAGEAPFNLVLLLDLSKSSLVSRSLMQQAARDFVKMAQPRDRLAIHVLQNTVFQVVCPLTSDRDRLLRAVDRIPDIAGGSPIYDALLLSGVQEPLYQTGEQPAIVILTDGMDNQFELPSKGSKIAFAKLHAAVKEWPIPIYTLLFPYESLQLQQRGKRNMQQLSDSSGGRLFTVAALEDLKGVYTQVAEELRSVYTIGYSPLNQEFDGRWRSVRLRSKRSGVTLRTRPGYLAR